METLYVTKEQCLDRLDGAVFSFEASQFCGKNNAFWFEARHEFMTMDNEMLWQLLCACASAACRCSYVEDIIFRSSYVLSNDGTAFVRVVEVLLQEYEGSVVRVLLDEDFVMHAPNGEMQTQAVQIILQYIKNKFMQRIQESEWSGLEETSDQHHYRYCL